jgi:uncharacterized protein
VTNPDHTPLAHPLLPTAGGERIAALDVIRGFALIGILLMNIEFFNRFTGDSGMGIAQGLSGPDLWFSYFVQYFVTGKFWTIFSTLFGMGFAIMLMRAQAAQRPFLGPYLRRILALAVFGALHHILLWNGDILFGYAAAATGLLIVLYGRLKLILPAIVLFAALVAVPGMGWGGGVAGAIAYFGLLAWYLRCPERITVFKRSMPLLKIVCALLGVAGLLTVAGGLLAPGLQASMRWMLPMTGALLVLLAVLMLRFHHPASARPWRTGAGLYALMMLISVAAGLAQTMTAAPAGAPVAVHKAGPEANAAAEQKKRVDSMLAERKAKKETELRVLTKGSYSEVVAMRTQGFLEEAPGQIGFATQIITMFLIGLWFVQSGVMANTGAHLPLFRKLALIGLPLGIALGLAGGAIATAADDTMSNGYTLALGLLMLGNLPASIGYIALVVLMLHSKGVGKRISVLAPFGRMALTNYLTHSLVFSFIFYGYGLGWFGIERIWQCACVCAMVLLQVPLSHLWLSRFRYGPLEWVWRAITYWQLPAMRITPADRGGALQAA